MKKKKDGLTMKNKQPNNQRFWGIYVCLHGKPFRGPFASTTDAEIMASYLNDAHWYPVPDGAFTVELLPGDARRKLL